ncbi:MAG: YqaJ viral recombinase family protein, partial [Gammaproteobacteria bacterium]|nr:YqaJ viral recombinase family protein [Gammaproteobacteria bacterium]
MKIIDAPQGSQIWHDIRAKHFNASEASAMMGDSKYMSRDELLKMKSTGDVKEIDPFRQKLFDKGHAAEAAIRPHIEELIGEELYPIVGTEEINGLPLLASFDGLTMMENIVFEHKLYGKELAMNVRNKTLHPHYIWQLEQQLLLSGAEKAIFVTSDGTPDKMEYMWYVSDPIRRTQLLNGWELFKRDLEGYEHTPTIEKPVVAELMELPALNIQINGGIQQSNLEVYKASALEFIKNINTNLQTDEDFAVAEKTVKFCKDAEDRIVQAKAQALSQTADIDDLCKTLDQLASEIRAKRLNLDKQVKNEKESKKREIIQSASWVIESHIEGLNKGLGDKYLNLVDHTSINLQNATKGKKLLSSIQSAANDEVARVKIEVNALAEKVRENLQFFNAFADLHKPLFHDLKVIVLKSKDDFETLVKYRIEQHEKMMERTAQVEPPIIPTNTRQESTSIKRSVTEDHRTPLQRKAREIANRFGE